VKGAGVSFVNGVYEWVNERAGASDYRRVCEDTGRVLTLFRCQMKSRVKWWFISEADKDQPGTDKDIDYYQQRANDEPEPPATGWVTCTSTGKEDSDGGGGDSFLPSLLPSPPLLHLLLPLSIQRY